jgi:galactokinase
MTTINNKILLESNKNFIKLADELYTDSQSDVIDRFSNLHARHAAWCPGESIFFSSPGRIEIIGNHTDHNNGIVLSATISLDTLALVTPSEETQIIIKSEGYEDVTIDISDLSCKPNESGTSVSLVKGVLKGFLNNGYKIGAFFATTTSTVMKGSGVSSSAAFEVLVCEILNQLYNNAVVPPLTKAIISKFAENVYFSKPSGLMDQLTIALGGVCCLDFEVQETPLISKLEWPFENLSIYIINCGGDHSDLTPSYASIKNEMVSIANYFKVSSLRKVDRNDFYSNIKELKKQFTGRAILRAIHFFDENMRVEDAFSSMQNKELCRFLENIKASGFSSLTKLQNVYVEGDVNQPIALALEISDRLTTNANKNQTSAVRIHGGGFAGTMLAFVPSIQQAYFNEKMSEIYGSENVFKVKIRNSGTIKLDL